MRKVFPFLLAAILAVAAASCVKETPILEVSPLSITLDRDGGEYSFTVRSNNAWQASASASWLKLSPGSGDGSSGSVTVKISADPNTNYDTRSGVITVKSGEQSVQVNVNQGEKQGLSLTRDLYRITSAEQSLLVEISTNIPYSVIIPDDCKSWIKILDTKAVKSTSVTFLISRNDTYDSREGTVIIRGETGVEAPLSIIQSQTNAILISDHHYGLSSDEQLLELKYSTNLKPEDFEIAISEGAREWIERTETPTKALRDETVSFLIKANPSRDQEREGMITFRSKDSEVSENVTVSQSAAATLNASTDMMLIPGDDLEFTLPFAANMDFEYFIDAGNGWLSRLESRSVTNYSLRFAAKANHTDLPRDGFIRFQSSNGVYSNSVRVRQLPLGTGVINIEFEGRITPETKFTGDVSWQYHWNDGTFAPAGENISKSFDNAGPHSYGLTVEVNSGRIEIDVAGIRVLDLRQY